MRIKRALTAIAAVGAVAAAVPAAASADASSPPNCFGEFIVAPTAQAGQAGRIVRAVEPAARGSFVVFIKENLC
jgi:hypothetical protein